MSLSSSKERNPSSTREKKQISSSRKKKRFSSTSHHRDSSTSDEENISSEREEVHLSSSAIGRSFSSRNRSQSSSSSSESFTSSPEVKKVSSLSTSSSYSDKDIRKIAAKTRFSLPFKEDTRTPGCTRIRDCSDVFLSSNSDRGLSVKDCCKTIDRKHRESLVKSKLNSSRSPIYSHSRKEENETSQALSNSFAHRIIEITEPSFLPNQKSTSSIAIAAGICNSLEVSKEVNDAGYVARPNRSSPVRDSKIKGDRKVFWSSLRGDSMIEGFMNFQVTIKRSHSSSSSSSSGSPVTEKGNKIQPSLKRRRLVNSRKSCKIFPQSPAERRINKTEKFATVMDTSFNRPASHLWSSQPTESSDSKERNDSLRNNLLKQTCRRYSSENDSLHRRASLGRSNIEEPESSPVTCRTASEARPNFGHSQRSPNSLTPGRQSKSQLQASPRFTSPSFLSLKSPRSTLRGLDQPQPWACDLIARSKTYSSTFIDTHCHIDLLYDRLGINHNTNFSDFYKTVACTFPLNFEGCIAVFCYPKTYDPRNPQNELIKSLSEDGHVWFALGCHPKSATDFHSRHKEGLRKLLGHPRVVALGEIGLDYSGSFFQHAETQKAVLRLQIQMALEIKLPLVIHCRDAYNDCLAILKEMVPYTWRIHLHCFCGNMETALPWLECFPNLYIGLTPVITYHSAQDSINAAQNIPLNRLLLETDSPYFVPGNIPRGKVHVSHPGFAMFTAERIAELRNISVDTVLQACRTNTRQMYGV